MAVPLLEQLLLFIESTAQVNVIVKLKTFVKVHFYERNEITYLKII